MVQTQFPCHIGANPKIQHQYQQSEDGGAFSGWEDISDSAAANGGNKASYIITSLTNGIPYSFQVRAVNVKDSVELYSDAASVNNTTPASKPDPPENLEATPNDASVELTWEAPSNNGGSPITKYAYRKKYGGRAWETSWTDIPDSAPPNGDSAETGSITPIGPPTAPTSLSATNGYLKTVLRTIVNLMVLPTASPQNDSQLDGPADSLPRQC